MESVFSKPGFDDWLKLEIVLIIVGIVLALGEFVAWDIGLFDITS